MTLKVKEDHIVRSCDIVHLLTAPDNLKDEIVRNYSNDPITLQYFMYLKNAYDVDKRDYQALRRLLTLIQIMYRPTLQEATETVVINQGIDTSEVRYVYDLGAGHSKWWDILLQTFPRIESLYRVDKEAQVFKDPMHNVYVQNVNQDVDEFLASRKCGGGPQHLYFMSELLHCKQRNFRFLTNEKISQSNLIVNELGDNPFINYRLMMTGGGLISSNNVKYKSGSQDWSVALYQAYFDYYIMARKA